MWAVFEQLKQDAQSATPMANSSFTQQALATDASFQLRVRAAIATVAWQVLDEDPEAPNDPARGACARTVIRDLAVAANPFAAWLVERPNLIAFETSYDVNAQNVVTATDDADIESQLAPAWDILAGSTHVGSPPLPR